MRAPGLPFSADDFADRVLARGTAGLDAEIGELDLVSDPLAPEPGAREAAVLVPVVDRPEGAGVILTVRSSSLRKHSGQIAFPGGSIEPGDASPEDAALRESFEEIGLEPRFVRPVGRLPRYATGTGFRITPVLGLVRPGFGLSPDSAEVADVFEVPLAFLMDAANHARGSHVWRGRERHFFVIPFGERRIWGITAGIIRALYDRLYA